MAKPELHQKTKIEDSTSLKGTLVMTTILGFILLVTWFGVFSLYVGR